MPEDLSAKRDRLSSELKAIIQTADDAKRELTPEESAAFDAKHAELEAVKGTLERAKKVEDYAPPVLPVVHDRAADDDGAAVRALSREESVRAWVEKQDKYFDEGGRLRIGTIMRAMVLGPLNDIEKRVLGEASDSTGGITVPDITSADFIDKLRAAVVCIRAGARTVPLQSDVTKIARLTADPTAAWRAEAGAVAESDPAFDGVTFAPKSLDVFFKVSRELVEDSLNIEAMLETALIRSFAVELDRAALYGSGTTSQPLGLRNMTSVNQVVMGGGTTAAQLLGFEKPIDTLAELWTDNVSASAMLMAPRTLATLSKLREGATTGQQLIPPSVLTAFPWLQTTSIPITETQAAVTTCSSIFLGDFAQMLFGLRTQMSIEVARELYRGNYQFGFFGHLRADVQVQHQEAFARLVGISVTGAPHVPYALAPAGIRAPVRRLRGPGAEISLRRIPDLERRTGPARARRRAQRRVGVRDVDRGHHRQHAADSVPARCRRARARRRASAVRRAQDATESRPVRRQLLGGDDDGAALARQCVRDAHAR